MFNLKNIKKKGQSSLTPPQYNYVAIQENPIKKWFIALFNDEKGSTVSLPKEMINEINVIGYDRYLKEKEDFLSKNPEYKEYTKDNVN